MPTDVHVCADEVQCYNASGNLLASTPYCRPNLPSRAQDMSKPTGCIAGDSSQHKACPTALNEGRQSVTTQASKHTPQTHMFRRQRKTVQASTQNICIWHMRSPRHTQRHLLSQARTVRLVAACGHTTLTVLIRTTKRKQGKVHKGMQRGCLGCCADGTARSSPKAAMAASVDSEYAIASHQQQCFCGQVPSV